MNESILQQFNCCVSCYFIAYFTVFLTLFMSSPSSQKKLESPLLKLFVYSDCKNFVFECILKMPYLKNRNINGCKFPELHNASELLLQILFDYTVSRWQFNFRV